MPDRASGDLRFFNLMSCMAERHEVTLCAYKMREGQEDREAATYRRTLRERGIAVRLGNPWAAFTTDVFDAVWFEFHFAARSYLKQARFCQPNARILVDSVDVHFNRLLTKARLTNDEKDFHAARRMKRRELRAYAGADVVLAVTEDDAAILRKELRDLVVEVVPNIHPVPPLEDKWSARSKSLLFVGNFRHDPNVDAVLYFCREILPLVNAEIDGVRVKIVGSNPPEEIRKLAGERVEILGFVPDLESVLRVSDISIAPLRYGGGMKGKVGEAMAFGLPVVTTDFGIEGFGARAGVQVLIGNSPQSFAEAVVQLLRDSDLYSRVRRDAWEFINRRYSLAVVGDRLLRILDRLHTYPKKALSQRARAEVVIRQFLDRNVSWRFRQS
jgi:glycosyltransferase involved in cell wall biosynthesis